MLSQEERRANRRATLARFYQRNRERMLAWAADYYKRNKKRIAAQNATYQNRIIANITPVYVRKVLYQATGLRSSEIPDEVVNLKQENINAKRKRKALQAQAAG